MALLCHPCITTANLSYRFPIFETSATALCGTTGIIYHPKKMWVPQTQTFFDHIEIQQTWTHLRTGRGISLRHTQLPLSSMVTTKDTGYQDGNAPHMFGSNDPSFKCNILGATNMDKHRNGLEHTRVEWLWWAMDGWQLWVINSNLGVWQIQQNEWFMGGTERKIGDINALKRKANTCPGDP